MINEEWNKFNFPVMHNKAIKCKTNYVTFIFRLKQLLSMYRVQFDFIDVVLANATSLKTMANFTTLWNQQFINQGKNKWLLTFTPLWCFHVLPTICIKKRLYYFNIIYPWNATCDRSHNTNGCYRIIYNTIIIEVPTKNVYTSFKLINLYLE